MTTLIEVRNSSGLVGRCDAKCYNAEHPKCDCICGGMNHGAGKQKAMDNTREHLKSWIKKHEKEEGFQVMGEALQRSLFGDDV
jgi:hypothetical protein